MNISNVNNNAAAPAMMPMYSVATGNNNSTGKQANQGEVAATAEISEAGKQTLAQKMYGTENIPPGTAETVSRNHEDKANDGDYPIKVAISKAGLDRYRESVAAAETEYRQSDDIEWLRENFQHILQTGLTDIVGQKVHDKQQEYGKANPDRGAYLDNQMNDFLKAYTAVYDEIIQSHENGTNDKRLISNGDGSFRQITKEDELAALDEYAEKKAADMAFFLKQDIMGAEIDAEREALHRKYGNKSGIEVERRTAEEKEMDAILLKHKKELMEKDISKELLSAIETIKANYSMFRQNLGGLVDNAFSGNITVSFEEERK